jgi:DNA-binding winged helix-turn-helix (wHTH) protein
MISFGDFRLDRRTRRLRHRGSERPLRAKSSAVLLHLAEHPNRLVTHSELLRTAWPGTTVSPTVLRVCIREIRAALGSEAEQLLKTVPRRGYRFTVEPSERGSAGPVFVGRETEKAALHEALARAQSGHRQIVFVAGESGAGKTALLDDFLESLRADGDVRCARGQALELQGRVEGCAPVLDLLSRLCDEAEGADVVEALARWAPGWLLQLPGRVDDATAESLRGRAPNASWDGRLLELGEAVEHLASAKPLVLVLEDLHWSDASTLDALAYLTRRTVTARLLVVGSFQPDALGLGHPFVETRERLQARGLAAEIALERLSLADVEAYLVRRLTAHSLAPRVARTIHDHSGGHAQRLAATVDHLLDERRLVLHDGQWTIDGTLAVTPLDGVGRRPTHEPPAGASPAGASDDADLDAERRQLTVMSCQLVGASDLAQRLDPEDLRSVVRAYQESASAVVQRYEGHVAQYAAPRANRPGARGALPGACPRRARGGRAPLRAGGALHRGHRPLSAGR